jgi:outer membrane lipoprotein LolB
VIFRLLSWGALLALSACSTWHPPPALVQPPLATDARAAATTGRWSGHLSLKLDAWDTQPAQGESFQFDLQGHAQAGVLDISTPFGTLVASVRWSPAGASLLTPQNEQLFDSMDALLTKAVGEALPVSTLMYWLKGQADPLLPVTWLSPAQPSAAEPTRFLQANWLVDTSELSQGILRAQREPQPQQRGARLVIRLDE